MPSQETMKSRIPKMRAAVMHAPRDLHIDEVPVPHLPHDGLLIRIRCCAICNGSDRIQYLGEGNREYPFVLGHEPSGEIAAIGKDIAGYAIGDRVTFYLKGGCFAEYVVIRHAQLAIAKLLPDMTYAQGALTQLLCSILRGTECAKIGPGDKVLVIGQGPVGLLAMQAAKALGAAHVSTAEIHPNRLELSKELGADLVINAAREDMVRKMRRGVDAPSVVFDAYGDDLSPHADTMSRAIKILEPSGRYVLFGLSYRPRSFLSARVVGKRITIVTPDLPVETDRKLIEQACKWIADGSVRVDPIISESIELEDLEEGICKTIEHPDAVVKIVVNI